MQFIIAILLLFLTAYTSSCKVDGDNTDGFLTGDPFDLDLALELGRLCLQAYQMLDDFNNGINFQLPPPFNLEMVFCTTEQFIGESIDPSTILDKQFCTGSDEVPIAFIATSGENIFLVFRGTATIEEWIKDAEFFKEPYTFVENAGNTEEGFTKIYSTIHNSIVDNINELSNSGSFTTLFVTGHSLGAALAILSVPEVIKNTSFTQPIMYNFAGPRVGDSTFKNLYDSLIDTSWRVVNTNDLVPHLPPEFLNYIHVNTEMPITFGQPITDLSDFTLIEENHEMCNYYNALCDMTSDPETCKEMAGGAHDCNT